jgi:hypothetical protein
MFRYERVASVALGPSPDRDGRIASSLSITDLCLGIFELAAVAEPGVVAPWRRQASSLHKRTASTLEILQLEPECAHLFCVDIAVHAAQLRADLRDPSGQRRRPQPHDVLSQLMRVRCGRGRCNCKCSDSIPGRIIGKALQKLR